MSVSPSATVVVYFVWSHNLCGRNCGSELRYSSIDRRNGQKRSTITCQTLPSTAGVGISRPAKEAGCDRPSLCLSHRLRNAIPNPLLIPSLSLFVCGCVAVSPGLPGGHIAEEGQRYCDQVQGPGVAHLLRRGASVLSATGRGHLSHAQDTPQM